jgi:predicted DNA-binding transcriptional regulator YafY
MGNFKMNYTGIWRKGCSMHDLPLVGRYGVVGRLILRALEQGLELEITHWSREWNEENVRRVIPEAVGRTTSPYGKNKYYLIAYCKKRHDHRTFNIDNIGQVRLTGKLDLPGDRGALLQQELVNELQQKLAAEQRQFQKLQQEYRQLQLQKQPIHLRRSYAVFILCLLVTAIVFGFSYGFGKHYSRSLNTRSRGDDYYER